MSGLSGFAILLATAQALMGKTWAGDRVLMAPLNSITVDAPTIAVYVGNGQADPEGRDISGVDVRLALKIEVHTPLGCTVTDGATSYTFDGDAGVSLLMSTIWRQCLFALNEDLGPWSDLYRAVVLRWTSFDFDSALYEDMKSKRRIGAYVYQMDVSCLGEPEFGQAPTGAWAQLLATMRGAGGDIATLADLVEHQMTNPTGLLSWQAAMADGLSRDGLAAAGIGPLDMPTDGDTVTMTGATLDDDDQGTSITLVDGQPSDVGV